MGDETSILPLRMKALLLLGLSHILHKKSQMLIEDCLRIQNAIGDIMCLSSTELPKDALIANDQQITLGNVNHARANVDVDFSFDQGEAVDRWIQAVCSIHIYFICRISKRNRLALILLLPILPAFLSTRQFEEWIKKQTCSEDTHSTPSSMTCCPKTLLWKSKLVVEVILVLYFAF